MEIWLDVTIAWRTNERTTEQGKIELRSQWTMDGWDEQLTNVRCTGKIHKNKKLRKEFRRLERRLGSGWDLLRLWTGSGGRVCQCSYPASLNLPTISRHIWFRDISEVKVNICNIVQTISVTIRVWMPMCQCSYPASLNLPTISQHIWLRLRFIKSESFSNHKNTNVNVNANVPML